MQRYGHLAPWPLHAGDRADRRRISQQDSQQPNFFPCGVACGTPGKYVIMRSLLACGEVREWPNRAVSKTAVLATGPWVRSPPSPPNQAERIRLNGIDCNEIGQAFDKRAKHATSDLAFGKEVTLRRSEALEGIFRSPRSILGANGPHEVRYVPPRLFARCGRAGRPF